MTRARMKHLERIHILRTIINCDGPVPAAAIVRRANTECDLDCLDELPLISPRGITMKLNGLSVAGLVKGRYPGGGRPMVWDVTDRGREFATSLLEAK